MQTGIDIQTAVFSFDNSWVILADETMNSKLPDHRPSLSLRRLF